MAKINHSNFSDLSEIFSQRGKLLLVYENYKFKEHNRKLASGETKWRCIKDKCKANFHTLGESKSRVITNLSVNHNHEPELINVLQRQVLSHCLKRKAESDITEKPSKMIRMELAKNDASLKNLTISDLQCARRNIYTARRKLLPALPKSLSQVHEALNELQPKTNRNEDFLIVNDLSENLVIFSCKSNIKFLCESKIIYMDGTFSYCTKYFTQMFTIHGFLTAIIYH